MLSTARRLALFISLVFALAPVARADPIDAQNELVVSGREAPRGRLGSVAVPRAYRLDLTIDPSQPRFVGHVEIDVDLAQDARTIVMHGRGLAMRSVVARAGNRVVSGGWNEVDPTGVVIVTFESPLPAGRATLSFDYDAPFAENPTGLFRVGVEGEWYVWSQFQSIDARAAFPSFDQPDFKAPFTVTLRTPPGMMAISNAPEAGAEATAQGVTIHRFEPTLPLPTYLVAIMVGPFAHLASVVPPTPQREQPLPLRIVATRPNADSLAYASHGSTQIIGLLEDYFGERFPFPKVDQISSPILPGAMENAGAILYRDDLLVMDHKAPIPQQREFGMTVAHEIAHHWFGDLVTPAWWDDLWLNESFANWLGYRIGEQWRPDLRIGDGALVKGFEAMTVDALAAGRPIRQAITTNARIDSAFDQITYGKGGQVVGMFAAYMGQDRFRAGVRRYIAAHRLGTATSDDFFSALAQEAGDARIVPAMRGFVEQQGVPLIVMRRSGNSVTMGQVRYSAFGTEPADAHWLIPVCLRRGTERACTMLGDGNVTVELGGAGPVMPNAGGTGYYRFELAGPHWSDLIAIANTLPSGEALALTDSLEASVLAGRGNIEELANLSRVLSRHPDSRAAASADKAMSRVVMMGIVDAVGRRGFYRFRQHIYMPLLKHYGFDPRAGAYKEEAPDKTQRRAQIVASLLGTPGGVKLRSKLTKATEAYLGGDRKALDESWLDHGLDLYLYFGNKDAPRRLLEMGLASEDPVFRPEALAAVARSAEPDVASWLLSLSDPRLRESERRAFLDGIMARKNTRQLGYDWIVANLDNLLDGASGPFFASRLPAAVGQFCSQDMADAIARDIRPRLADTPAALDLDRAIERVRNCAVLDKALGLQISNEFASLN